MLEGLPSDTSPIHEERLVTADARQSEECAGDAVAREQSIDGALNDDKF